MQLFIAVLACFLAAAGANDMTCSYGDANVVMEQWDAVFTAANGGKVSSGFAIFTR